ncbi:Holliday junction DNA helicase RuvB [Candidatus Kaiserbacteria bacterium RIFCSPHIGHO2_02_FULL_59_21]|uniref:Holliday junction branch migration complex subunit RuvB n=1 Tax=Candidatus Kaiserbacteria bacterium RIFCSPHIGHO2_02_FULL_59_21 TaxID=1798500 RepID=A0A1F6E0F5_9BACT|nr:MAG: Holliday junction DNA helicase RuvB [Candidatus Kaiserbacteria bacterium RIFCSPHIGHO2_01_FULL_58_22]OGG67143.1 MAG: Holliday junction DNA helicase RuvB [Candidatus Kaiserbacteria bacterium RIFCSPHIGHO2_02_FULL_59_21]OGG79062.1 MAG: Holliday junction DNA helicase RuvB [Candidatus Kaiserbacteria bacterium RIFCSPLOWO2_01_FULL_59_34]OGG86333.1 MAG: Holliday junction DNA helicase RuvB [Candidatus Kaiserbacteria bacterium RIFCSPLOWO2_02_FULL_59_19]
MSTKKEEKSAERAGRTLDQALRPEHWKEYVGQATIKENLRILLSAAKGRNHQPEHVLLYGPPGLGKTTLAHLMAKEIGASLRATSGPAIERVGDLASILTNLSPGDVLFIDEMHRLNRAIEEVLYPAMENGVLDIVIGKGPSARTVQLELPPFTLIAATTRISMLSAPLRSRFSGGTFRLNYYDESEVAEILKRSASILRIAAADESIREIARRARATPRTANYLLKRARDFAEVNGERLDLKTVQKALALLEIDEAGLNQTDRDILAIIVEKFNGGPVGLKTVSASLSEEEETIEEVHEPYLMQLGLLERTPRGRQVTKKGREHIGLLARHADPGMQAQQRLV